MQELGFPSHLPALMNLPRCGWGYVLRLPGAGGTLESYSRIVQDSVLELDVVAYGLNSRGPANQDNMRSKLRERFQTRGRSYWVTPKTSRSGASNSGVLNFLYVVCKFAQ